jgi:hypothetical protein
MALGFFSIFLAIRKFHCYLQFLPLFDEFLLDRKGPRKTVPNSTRQSWLLLPEKEWVWAPFGFVCCLGGVSPV